MRSFGICSLVGVLCAVAGSAARAQLPEPGVVTGTGVVILTHAPETMRLQVALSGKGATLEDAMASLKTHSDSARKRLAELGAEKESIKVEAPRVAVQQNNQRRQMEMMLAQRMKGKGKRKGKAEASPPITVNAMLSAEWRLKAKDGTGDDLLAQVYPLQEKIKAADLGGAKETEKLTPEEEELNAELEAQGYNNFGNDGEQKPGEPIFLFASVIGEAERDKALAEAYQRASKDAGRLARAAGVEVGALRSLNSTHISVPENEAYGYSGHNAFAYRAMQMMMNGMHRPSQNGESAPSEAIGTEPVPLNYNISVSASFDIKRSSAGSQK